jgi:hypothetical protein
VESAQGGGVMGLWSKCLDCGRDFMSDHHCDECQYCYERNAAMYANVPPNKEEDRLFRRHRRPPLPGEGGIDPKTVQAMAIPPAPRPPSHQLRVCRCGHAGSEFFRTGILSRLEVCDACGRTEEREYLRRMGDRPVAVGVVAKVNR